MGNYFYHTEFSIKEIKKILLLNGFKILHIETQSPGAISVNLNRFRNKIPYLKYMGSEIMIVAMKNIENTKSDKI